MTEPDCGTLFFEPGEAWRFFAAAGTDGAVLVKGCGSARTLTDPERAQPVGPPDGGVVAPPPPSPPPPPPPAPSQRGSCSAAEPAPRLASLALLLLLLVRRRPPGQGRHRFTAGDQGTR